MSGEQSSPKLDLWGTRKSILLKQLYEQFTLAVLFYIG